MADDHKLVYTGRPTGRASRPWEPEGLAAELLAKGPPVDGSSTVVRFDGGAGPLDLANAIGEDLEPQGPWVLICQRCRRRQDLQPGDFTRYVRSGWPKCCAETMTLDRPPDG